MRKFGDLSGNISNRLLKENLPKLFDGPEKDFEKLWDLGAYDEAVRPGVISKQIASTVKYGTPHWIEDYSKKIKEKEYGMESYLNAYMIRRVVDINPLGRYLAKLTNSEERLEWKNVDEFWMSVAFYCTGIGMYWKDLKEALNWNLHYAPFERFVLKNSEKYQKEIETLLDLYDLQEIFLDARDRNEEYANNNKRLYLMPFELDRKEEWLFGTYVWKAFYTRRVAWECFKNPEAVERTYVNSRSFENILKVITFKGPDVQKTKTENENDKQEGEIIEEIVVIITEEGIKIKNRNDKQESEISGEQKYEIGIKIIGEKTKTENGDDKQTEENNIKGKYEIVIEMTEEDRWLMEKVLGVSSVIAFFPIVANHYDKIAMEEVYLPIFAEVMKCRPVHIRLALSDLVCKFLTELPKLDVESPYKEGTVNALYNRNEIKLLKKRISEAVEYINETYLVLLQFFYKKIVEEEIRYENIPLEICSGMIEGDYNYEAIYNQQGLAKSFAQLMELPAKRTYNSGDMAWRYSRLQTVAIETIHSLYH